MIRQLRLPIFLLLILLSILWLRDHSKNLDVELPNPSTQEELPEEQDEFRITAHFAIYTNGTFRVFTAPMYHHAASFAFLEEEDPNLIIVMAKGVTWRDFFATLPLSLSHECLVTGTNEEFCTNQEKSLLFYLNGERKEDVLDRQIQDGDQLLISYGSDAESVISSQLDTFNDLSK